MFNKTRILSHNRPHPHLRLTAPLARTSMPRAGLTPASDNYSAQQRAQCGWPQSGFILTPLPAVLMQSLIICTSARARARVLHTSISQPPPPPPLPHLLVRVHHHWTTTSKGFSTYDVVGTEVHNTRTYFSMTTNVRTSVSSILIRRFQYVRR